MTSKIRPVYGLSGGRRSGGAAFSSYDTRAQTLLNNAVASGSDDKDWKAKLSKRQNVSHSYERFDAQYRSGWISHYNRYLYGGKKEIYNQFDYIQPPLTPYSWGVFPSNSDTATVRDIAWKRFKDKYANDEKQFQLLVPLAEIRELRQTLHGVAYAASNMLETLIALKHGKLRDAHKRASDVWLTFSFGVNPMISDAQNIAEAIAALLNNYRTARYVGTATTKWIVDSPPGIISTDVFSNHTFDYQWRCEFGVQVTGAIDHLMLSANNYGAAQQFRLGAENLPSILWELTPFSWVVDYFTTTGAYLDDVFYTPSGSTRYLVQTERFKASLYTSYGNSFKNGTYPHEGDVITHSLPKVEYFHFRRTPQTNIARRALRFKTVDEIGANWFNRVLNLASVLGGSRRKLKPNQMIPII